MLLPSYETPNVSFYPSFLPLSLAPFFWRMWLFLPHRLARQNSFRKTWSYEGRQINLKSP